MGRPQTRRWNTCLMWFVTSVGALCLTISCIGAENEGVPNSFIPVEKPVAPGADCKQPDTETSAANRHLMLVSTLDGRLSALDVKEEGKLLWSVQADTRPLLSSSISKLMILQDEVPTRYIPSLDGGLYKYDGESIEAVPITAESLLSSSFRLADSTVVVGGNDLKSYGIDPVTGQVRYVCGAKGCHMFGDDITKEEDVLVVTRNTKTVRGVDTRTGLEQWNFSVGQHDINFLNGQRKVLTDNSMEDEDGAFVIPCPSEDTEMDVEDFINSIKIVVPEGRIVGVNPENMQTVTWQHKFNSPVSNAWLLYQGQLHSVDMFDNRHIPALSSFEADEQTGPPPLLYVGMHQNQLYVQPSSRMAERVSNAAEHFQQSTSLARLKDLPRVAWKPYLNTAQFRTPSMRGTSHPEITHVEKSETNEADEQSLTVWHEHYPFDNGYYLYPEFSVPFPAVDDDENLSSAESSEYSIMDEYLPVTLWNWWKEVLAISIISSVIVHVVLSHLAHKQTIPSLHSLISTSQSGRSEGSNSQQSEEFGEKVEDSKTTSRQNSDESKAEYVSRYATDFDHIQILGKGGFGVVFETKNKVDDCHYAVKRISLPNSDGAKEKVMREVKALAKLDHIGIVRYFHAWLESPPPGWQEEKDKEIEDSECMSVPTPCNSVSIGGTSDFLSHGNTLSKVRGQLSALHGRFGGAGNNPLRLSETDIKRGGSEEFSVQSGDTFEEEEESGSFSCGVGTPSVDTFQGGDNSVDIEFRLSDEDTNSNNNAIVNNTTWAKKHIPFSNYSSTETESSLNAEDTGASDSVQIVFEDSGCGEKSSKGSNSWDVVIGIQSSQSNDLTGSHDLKHPPIKGSHSRTPSKDLAQLTYEKEDNKKAYRSSEKIQTNETDKMSAPKSRLYLFIQMQLCKRETLKDWLSANTLNRDRHMVLDMFDQIVSAVEYVHDCGLMHRDLKPSNIFFSLDGVIKMGDFGLVTALAEEQNEALGNSCNPGQKHTAQVGTQLYMSPEQTSGKVYCHKVDIFSLGVILFELLYPFATQMERVDTLGKVKQQKLPDRFTREMPNESKFVSMLLSPNPDERPSATEILNSELLTEFVNRRMPSRFRTRTVSQNSS